MLTYYLHIENIIVKEGQEVKKGEIISYLYKDKGDKRDTPVHLHFEMLDLNKKLFNKTGLWEDPPYHNNYNPELIFDFFSRVVAVPQGSLEFKIQGYEIKEEPEIIISNLI